MTQTITHVLDQRGQIDVIYTDMSKAFDKVNQELLLVKLSEMGMSVISATI